MIDSRMPEKHVGDIISHEIKEKQKKTKKKIPPAQRGVAKK